ncbi:hypothetical protein BJ508DRAFT_65852 [Ascobolus immersus RN42]|uniref:Uncharacterized protein n=1 Tax=Ascobolus immersus RN42 TaxID=1160509 RepID=A0A3N4IBI5_ASCIM|nr:hypothetical protein BJ508DRAFT_65852 [Ascobolus immersus RN42]
MGVSGEDLRRRRIQKDVNNTSGYLWNGRMMNGSSTSTTESAESTPLSEVANTRIRSRPDHPTTVPANMGDKSEPPDSDVSDNDTPFKPQATLRFSTRRTKDEITLRERVDLSTFNGTSTLRTSREKHQSKKKSTSGKVATYHKKSTALPIHKKEKATPDLELSGPDAEFMNRVKEQLKLHMEKMRKEHKYQLVSALRRARIDIDKPQEGAQHYDKESPFKAMKPIELREYDLEEDTDISQYHTKLSIKHKEQGTSTFGDKELLYCPSIDVRSFKDCHPSLIKPNTRFNIVPKYHIYTTLANNVMVEDDDILRFVPYLGEESNEAEDAELFEENYALDLSKHARENGQQRELVEWISEDIERLLNLFETSINALSFYLIGDLETVHGVDAVSMEKSRQFFFAPDHDPEYHKTKSELAQRRRNLKPVKADELRRAEIVCRALRDVVGVRAWFVLKAITNEGKHRALANLGPCAEDRYRPLFSNDEDYEQSPEEQKMAVLSGGNPIPYQIDSYAKLHCPVCYMHQCPFHAATESISDSVISISSISHKI